jgi:hypothetical protein
MAKVKWLIWIGVFFLLSGFEAAAVAAAITGRRAVIGPSSIFFLALGGFMVVLGLIIALKPGGILRREQVIDNWSVLIEGAQGKADNIFNDTEFFLKESKAPDIALKRRKMTPGVIKGVLGQWRQFLVTTETGNPRLRPYQLFINARDYGVNLDISWYIACRPAFWQSLLSLIPFVNLLPKEFFKLDLFDQQDLRAYATNAHHCLLKAVEKLMVDLHQDPSKIDRKSRGFLGIS